jgi:hypothetical protein
MLLNSRTFSPRPGVFSDQLRTFGKPRPRRAWFSPPAPTATPRTPPRDSPGWTAAFSDQGPPKNLTDQAQLSRRSTSSLTSLQDRLDDFFNGCLSYTTPDLCPFPPIASALTWDLCSRRWDLGSVFSTLESRSFCGGAVLPRDTQSQYVDQGLTRRKPFRFRGGSPGITMTNSYKPQCRASRCSWRSPIPALHRKFLRKVSLVTCRPLGATTPVSRRYYEFDVTYNS